MVRKQGLSQTEVGGRSAEVVRWQQCSLSLLPVLNYPVLVSLLGAIAHYQHGMVHIITVAIFVIVHTYETNCG